MSARFDLGRVLRLFRPVEKATSPPPPAARQKRDTGKPRPAMLKGRNTPESESSSADAKVDAKPSPAKAKAKTKKADADAKTQKADAKTQKADAKTQKADAKVEAKSSPAKAKAKKAETKGKSASKSADKAVSANPDKESDVPRVSAMEVRHHKDGWMLKIPGVDEPAWVVSTKAKAVAAAKDAAEFHSAKLSVFTRSGDLQKTIPA